MNSKLKENEKLIVISGAAQRDPESRASILIKFGRRDQLSENQLETIKWFKNLRCEPSFKKNMVSLILNSVTKEEYNRIISILNNEKIKCSIEE